jgi:hypothetical protein
MLVPQHSVEPDVIKTSMLVSYTKELHFSSVECQHVVPEEEASVDCFLFSCDLQASHKHIQVKKAWKCIARNLYNRIARFFWEHYTKIGKYTPNVYKMYQAAI